MVDHSTCLPGYSSYRTPLRTSRVSPAHIHSAGSRSLRTPLTGCSPLAISSPLASALMSSLKAATAAFHACCIGTENGSYDRGERPRGKSVPRIQVPLEVGGQSGAAARVEEQELLYRVVGGGRSMALH